MEKHKIIYIGNDRWSHQLDNIQQNLSNKCDVVAIFTEPNTKNFDNRGCPVYRDNINEKLETVQEYKPDFMIVYGCPYLLKQPVLNIAPVIGMHPTLLPMRRGHAPLNWAIIDGLEESGVTLMFLDKGADSGDIIYQKKFSIDPRDTINDLLKKANDVLIKMTTDLIVNYPNVPRTTQNHSDATYKKKRMPADGEIRWDTMSTEEIDRLIRATTGPHYPGAFFVVGNKKIVLWDAVFTIQDLPENL